jgi:hypothetical protein
MARKVLISLVSKQTIPNILLIKEFPPQDLYVFLTTEEMESDINRKSETIIETARIAERLHKTVKVIEDKFESIVAGLQSFLFTAEDTITVNITGGTKPMSLATYNFFKEKQLNVQFLYKAQNKYEFIYLETGEVARKIDSQLSVHDYLEANGINCKSKKPIKNLEYNIMFYNRFTAQKIELSILEQLRRHYRGKKRIEISAVEAFEEETEADRGKQIPSLSKMLESNSFILEEHGWLNKSELEYLTGGWFEELVYYKMKEKYPHADVQLGVKLEKGNKSTDSDLDVVVCRNDSLEIIECKTSLAIDGKYTSLFNETVFKASAINKNFGLTVQSFLFTLDDFTPKNFNDFWEKSKVFGIKLFDKPKLENLFPDLLHK